MARKNRRIKKRRSPGGLSRIVTTAKSGKRKSGLSRKTLHGMPHGKRVAQTRKLSKTQKRPSGMFGGILTSRERTKVFEEAIKVKIGLKSLDEVELHERGFVEQALQYINKKSGCL